MLQEGDGLWAILEKIQTEQVGGLTVDDIQGILNKEHM